MSCCLGVPYARRQTVSQEPLWSHSHHPINKMSGLFRREHFIIKIIKGFKIPTIYEKLYLHMQFSDSDVDKGCLKIVFFNGLDSLVKLSELTPVSIIFWKWTPTVQKSRFLWFSLSCIKTLIFLDRILFARKPKTNNMESMTLDFPLPLGPTIDVKLC